MRRTSNSAPEAKVIARDALDPTLTRSEAQDTVYALLSPDLHRVLTVERGWSADRYQRWLARALRAH